MNILYSKSTTMTELTLHTQNQVMRLNLVSFLSQRYLQFAGSWLAIGLKGGCSVTCYACNSLRLRGEVSNQPPSSSSSSSSPTMSHTVYCNMRRSLAVLGTSSQTLLIDYFVLSDIFCIGHSIFCMWYSFDMYLIQIACIIWYKSLYSETQTFELNAVLTVSNA